MQRENAQLRASLAREQGTYFSKAEDVITLKEDSPRIPVREIAFAHYEAINQVSKPGCRKSKSDSWQASI